MNTTCAYKLLEIVIFNLLLNQYGIKKNCSNLHNQRIVSLCILKILRLFNSPTTNWWKECCTGS